MTRRFRSAATVVALAVGTVTGYPHESPAQPISPLTDLRLRTGIVSAEDSRAWLIGTWEPDADLDLPPGANTITYLADGLYLNPFRGNVLVGIWDATADSLTMTPLEMRQLDTGIALPELMTTFGFIKWNTPGTKPLKWLSSDRFQDGGQREPWRRREPVFDFTPVRAAVLRDRLVGSWIDERSIVYTFDLDGRFSEVMTGTALWQEAPLGSDLTVVVTGTYQFDRSTHALQRQVQDVTTTGITLPATRGKILERGRALDVTRAGNRKPATLRWLDHNRLLLEGHELRRRN